MALLQNPPFGTFIFTEASCHFRPSSSCCVLERNVTMFWWLSRGDDYQSITTLVVWNVMRKRKGWNTPLTHYSTHTTFKIWTEGRRRRKKTTHDRWKPYVLISSQSINHVWYPDGIKAEFVPTWFSMKSVNSKCPKSADWLWFSAKIGGKCVQKSRIVFITTLNNDRILGELSL